MSATDRAQTRLAGTSQLAVDEVQSIVKDVAKSIKGGGMSLLTTGFANVGAQVNIKGEGQGVIKFSVSSGKQLVELCTFTGEFRRGERGTEVTLGGLESYRTNQQKLWGIIPMGPKMIVGMAPYKRFLEEANAAIRSADPTWAPENSQG